ncbi:MAG: SDR family oxidoreductase [Blastocatellia bacterium]
MARDKDSILSNYDGSEIAIIAANGRFPGAKNVAQLWQNLCNSVDSITFLSDKELIDNGVPEEIINQSNYVKAAGLVEDIEYFDASFFGFSPREAELLDPQYRLFLEIAWEALELAGYTSEKYSGRIGIYAGSGGLNNYYTFNIYPDHRQLIEWGQDKEDVGFNFESIFAANAKDFLTTYVSYKLNLKGPSVNIQTACSTSLVAVHLACQSLLNGESDIALAGGISLRIPQISGYFYSQQGVYSPDGHCHTFDANAKGAIFSSGAAIVVLKRLSDAIEDGDNIIAIIKGSAINNDGYEKIGFTAPSIDGQAEVIAEAQAIARVSADTIGYIEAHGTGTELGDPIEVTALTKAFRASTDKTSFCAIGSIKTNIGHLDSAAGVTGLIKTSLSLKNKMIPASLHFEKPNSRIDFENSPFYVNTKLNSWSESNTPRRAGVTALGIGGTNAHVVLEEAPTIETDPYSRSWQVLFLSAKTETALEKATENLKEFLIDNPDVFLPDLAYTYQVGRKDFNFRRIAVCKNNSHAKEVLSQQDNKYVFSQYQESKNPSIVFMFPGGGAQYVNMAKEIYQQEAVFRECLDQCAEILLLQTDIDFRKVLYPDNEEIENATKQIKSTSVALPTLFSVEYAMAKLWQSWGIQPSAMIGHSLGEYVVACLAEVLTLEEALSLVLLRGKLFEKLPSGSMLSVALSEKELLPLLNPSLDIAAINSPNVCLVAGASSIIEEFAQELSNKNIDSRRLAIDTASHCRLVEPILEEFTRYVEKLPSRQPQLPYVSNVTGCWITDEDLANPQYWVKHLRHTIRFGDGITLLLENAKQVILEVGPQTLSGLIRQQISKDKQTQVLSSIRHPQEQESDVTYLMRNFGKLWLSGVEIDWKAFYSSQQRQRIAAPTYPFEKQRYWINSTKKETSKIQQIPKGQKPNIADWFYLPVWEEILPATATNSVDKNKVSNWLVFTKNAFSNHLVTSLQNANQKVTVVKVSESFLKENDFSYAINPTKNEHYQLLIKSLREQQQAIDYVVHCWNLDTDSSFINEKNTIKSFEEWQSLGFYSLLFLTQALNSNYFTNDIEITVLSTQLQSVTGQELILAEKATLLGIIKVISQEYPNLHCRSIDIDLPNQGIQLTRQIDKITQELLHELLATDTKHKETVLAYRNGRRWRQQFKPVHLKQSLKQNTLKEDGVYLITGGLGNIGLTFAEYLATLVKCKQVLLSRSNFPASEQWDNWLATHPNTDPISEKIHRLRKIEALGSQLLIINADVANKEQMSDALKKIKENFTKINGLIHSAGIAGRGVVQVMEELQEEKCKIHFLPKCHGLINIAELLGNEELDFYLLISSLSSILGGLGLAAYASANSFVDAFARKQSLESQTFWYGRNWEAVQITEDSSSEAQVGKLETMHGEKIAQYAITVAQLQETTERVLTTLSVAPQLIISSGELSIRMEGWVRNSSELQTDQKPLHQRPTLQTAYEKPRNEIEEQISDIWQQLLGVKDIGIHDNFFELGGHSLLATQIVTRLRAMYQVELSLQKLFEHPTVAELAELIEELLLEQLEEMSDEEALDLINQNPDNTLE